MVAARALVGCIDRRAHGQISNIDRRFKILRLMGIPVSRFLVTQTGCLQLILCRVAFLQVVFTLGVCSSLF
jgi:hypothetical protein